MTPDYYDLYIDYGRYFMENHIRHTVKVYRINIIKSKSHSLYGESKPSDKSFMEGVEIFIMPVVDNKDQYYYGDSGNGITRDDTGNITFNVYLKELKEKGLEINRGDIIEYNLSGEKNRYYEVEYSNNVTDLTNQTVGGHKPYIKKVVAVPVKEDFANLINEKKGL